MSAVASVSTPGVLPTAIPALGGGRNVDVVEADGVVADHPQTGCGIQQGGVDPFGQQREQSLAIGHLPPQHVGRRWQRFGPDVGVAVVAHPFQSGGGD